MEKFGFGSKPRMKEVPPGTEAIFRFNGKPEIIETEYGEKFSFPIILISHDSYDTLPFDCNWESKSMVAKEVFIAYEQNKDFKEVYNTAKWQLTRFDTGAYFLDQL